MKSITLADELYYKVTNFNWRTGRVGPWANFNKFPPAPQLPPKPWHADGDALLAGGPLVRVDNSSAIIEHMKSSGRLVISTGSVIPNAEGKTEGRRVNIAVEDDPKYTIVTSATQLQAGRILVNDGQYPKVDRNLVGTQVRIPREVIRQGFPMRNYSDTKVHIFDAASNVIVEIQHCEEMPVPSGRAYRAHGLSVIDLSGPQDVGEGRSAAKISLTESVLRFDDLMSGWRQTTTMGTPAAFKLDYLAPARGTDGPSTHPNAVWMGMVLRMKPGIARELKAMGRPQLSAVVECYEDKGLMVVDTSGNHATGLDPDARWDQAQLNPLRSATLDWFDIWKRVS
jgi:hypothetical protein